MKTEDDTDDRIMTIPAKVWVSASDRIRELEEQVAHLHAINQAQAVKLKSLEKLDMDVRTGQLRTYEDWDLAESHRGMH